MTRPNDFVFHGSAQQGLRVIQPDDSHARRDLPRPLVFASRYKAMACCYMLHTARDWARVVYDQNGHIALVSCDAGKLPAGKKGSLYMLRGDAFTSSDRGMEYMEWVADTPQDVVRETPYDCIVTALKDFGVALYSLDPENFAVLANRLGDELYVLLSDAGMQAARDFLDTNGRRL